MKKYLLFIILGLSLSSINLYSDCANCPGLPDDWDCTTSNGQPNYPGDRPCYNGYFNVEVNEEDKNVNCWDPGTKKCTIPLGSSFSALHNELIKHADDEVNFNSVLSGSHSINMIIDGNFRYGSVSWNTNTTTNVTLIQSVVN